MVGALLKKTNEVELIDKACKGWAHRHQQVVVWEEVPIKNNKQDKFDWDST